VPPVDIELKKQVKQANDIVEVVSAYLPVLPQGKTYKCLCPFHNDTRPSLVLDRHYQNFRCWACDTRGDVFDFVMKFEKVTFPEALQILAQRAGIKLEAQSLTAEDYRRKQILEVLAWAQNEFSRCYIDESQAEAARAYMGGRQISGGTVRQFGLGYAPAAGQWLVDRAQRAGWDLAWLQAVGLIAARDQAAGYYDRFRDRVMFPIRDVRGQTVGFGGRILPTSPLAARGPKYYNSPETEVFKKQELIYGLDLARHAGTQAGYLAIVEGYTDVMMAHQKGIPQVVATMGTALTLNHVLTLRRFVPRVVLVFDSDDAGESAADKSQELFWGQHNFEIAVATLPQGLDPYDLLAQPDGEVQFRQALEQAKDVHEFKIDSLFKRYSTKTLSGQQQIIDAALGFLALAEAPSAAAQMKIELAVTRLAHRLGLRQETIWSRLGELKRDRKQKQRDAQRLEGARQMAAPAQVIVPQGMVPQSSIPQAAAARAGNPPAHLTPKPATKSPLQDRRERAERQLLEILLADASLVSKARERVLPEEVQHTGLRRMLAELYGLLNDGLIPDKDALQVRLLDRPDLADAAHRLQEVGLKMTERDSWLERVLNFFAEFHNEIFKNEVKETLAKQDLDEAKAVDLLRRLQETKPASPRATGGPPRMQ